MNVITITGANSFIGTHLMKHLSTCTDLRFRILVNRNLNAWLSDSDRTCIIKGDLLKPKTLNGLVEPGCIVVNLAYLRGRPLEENIRAIENLIENCASAKIKRFIHCSTAVVAGRVLTNRITEKTPLNPLNEYEVAKTIIEKTLLDKSQGLFEVTILRPTAVFGKGGRNLIKLADDLRFGNIVLNYIKSCVYQYRRMNLVYVANVVAAIAFLIRMERNINNETFIISDDEAPTNNYRDIENYLKTKMGCRAYRFPLVSFPFVILKTLLRLSGRTNINPTVSYDCSKILAAGFKKPFSFQEGLSLFSDCL